MDRRQIPRAVLATVCAVALVFAAGTLDVSAAERELPSSALLPDLDQETPSQLGVRQVVDNGHRHWVLGFASAIRNLGDGPLIVDGNRIDAGDGSTMEADQLVETADGEQARLPAVGELTFVRSPDHNHWHYIGFDRYELRAAGSTQPLVRDRKSGFCLGDRYRVITRVVSDAPAQPVFTGNCGTGRPDLTHVQEGISIGYGDNYAAYLEYQDLRLDGLPDGRYVLVHAVNEDRSLAEVSYANNASSLLLDLRWQGGTPYVRALDSCPDTDRCDQTAEVDTVATGLEVPWDLQFLPNGRALVTERAGRVRLLTKAGRLRARPVATVDVAQRGEGGLLGLAVDPDFATNRYVYLYFTAADAMRLERWRWRRATLVPDATLLDQVEAGDIHDSGRIRFGPDGRLYVATGDAGEPALAQDPNSLNGKILALTADQYHGSGVVAAPTVVASGLRNPQGLSWQPGTGQLVANDHGPSGFDGPEGYDEVDVIVPGGNYGWPEAISNQTGGGRYLPPARVYVEPIAPSGGTFLSKPGTTWQGQYVLAGLRGEELRRLVFEGDRVVADEPFLVGQYGRLRSVTEAPDGSLYVLTSNRDGRGSPVATDDRILRVRLPAS